MGKKHVIPPEKREMHDKISKDVGEIFDRIQAKKEALKSKIEKIKTIKVIKLEKKQIQKSGTVKREPRYCNKCGFSYSYFNFSTHHKNCKGNKLHRSDFLEERNNLTAENKLIKEKIAKLKLENQQLKLKLKTQDEPDLDIEQFISSKALNTKKSYLTHWTKYQQWCYKNERAMDYRSSVCEYYSQLNNQFMGDKKIKSSTKNLIRSILIKIFKEIFSKDISNLLSKRNINHTPGKTKYAMPDQEIIDYLAYFKDNPEDFLAQFILIFSGCRIHTLAALIGGDVDLALGTLTLTDYKTRKQFFLRYPNKDFTNMMSAYISKTVKTTDQFLFYPSKKYSTLPENMAPDEKEKIIVDRSKYVSQILRFKIKTNLAFKHVDMTKFILSPHMFRKTKAMLIYEHCMTDALAKVREGINQSENSSSVFKYLEINPLEHLDFFADILKELAAKVFLDKEDEDIKYVHDLFEQENI